MNVLPKKLSTIASALLLGAALTGASAMSHAQTTDPTEPVSMVTLWDKTFAQSDKVDHRKVTFKNRYGLTLVADLYLPKNRGDGKLAAIAVSGPFGAVKEQSSGLYAQTLAEQGFSPWRLTPPLPARAAANRGMWPRLTSTPRISAPPSISSACKRKSTATASAS